MIGDYDNCLGVEDYDYWMRINELFEIKHLGTPELLYSYRVHDNTLSARASQLKIFDRGRELMRYQRDRSAYFNIPWTIRIARTAWLGSARRQPGRTGWSPGLSVTTLNPGTTTAPRREPADRTSRRRS